MSKISLFIVITYVVTPNWSFLTFYVTVSANVELTNAVKKTGDIYNEIGSLFEEQPKFDWEPLADTLHIYKGIISSFPDILAVHKVCIFYTMMQSNCYTLYIHYHVLLIPECLTET